MARVRPFTFYRYELKTWMKSQFLKKLNHSDRCVSQRSQLLNQRR